MSLNIEEKKAVVTEVTDVLSAAQATILAEYRGLTVAQMTDLRNSARESGVYLRVVKNTLARRAVDGSPFECLQEHMVGPLAYAIAEDPAACAKVLKNFAKDNGEFTIKVGAMSGKLLTEDEITALSKLPGREELLAPRSCTSRCISSVDCRGSCCREEEGHGLPRARRTVR